MGRNMRKRSYELYKVEAELLKRCNLLKERFHLVNSTHWEVIYQNIAEAYADKTKSWKNGLHWANTNGYSPKCRKNFIGRYPVDYTSWFYLLPRIIPDNPLVYFLIDKGGRDWHFGEEFWVFETYLPELIKALEVLTQTAFLMNGWLDYYIVGKKYQWIMGVNHHDILSCVGEGLDVSCLTQTIE